MTKQILPTQEIGSLKKPDWRVLSFRGDPIPPAALREAAEWGKRLGIKEYPKLIQLLKEKASPARQKAIVEWSIRYAIRFFEATDLDTIYTGEQARVEMYEHVIRRVPAFAVRGSVNSLDYAYYKKAAVTGKPRYEASIYLDEFLVAKRFACKPLKVPITGPYTIVDWSFNEHYELQRRLRIADWSSTPLAEVKRDARRDFLLDLVDGVYRPEIRRLVEAGATWIQLDEPAVTTQPQWEEMEMFVEAYNRLTEGFSCRFSLHNCYSDYRVLARYIPRLKNCSQIALEFANRDGIALGSDDSHRPGYADLRLFAENGFEGQVGVGVLHIHHYEGEGSRYAKVVEGFLVETPELIRDRLLYACKVLGEDRVVCNPDCGGRRLPWNIYHWKLQALVQGAKLASRELGH